MAGSLWIQSATVLLNYNFIFSHMITRGIMRHYAWYHANTTLHPRYVFAWNMFTACVECTYLVEVHACNHTCGSTCKEVHVRNYIHTRKYTRMKQNTHVLRYALYSIIKALIAVFYACTVSETVSIILKLTMHWRVITIQNHRTIELLWC